jgi:dienelactone hydrolase
VLAAQPEIVTVSSVGVELHGLLWYPPGNRHVPAILFNHGRGCVPQPQCDDREQKIRRLGELFAEHGYAFLAVFRRGEGLSAGVGRSAGEQLEQEKATHGSRAADRLQVRLLESEQLDDALAGLTYLRGLPRVDSERIAVVGHSFGGSLSLVLAERAWNLRAVVTFGAAAQSWNVSPRLRQQLTGVAQRLRVPALLVYASNDYSVQPGKTLSDAIHRGVGSCELSILPANGTTIEEGHDLVYSGSDSWGPLVFDFLARHMGSKP